MNKHSVTIFKVIHGGYGLGKLPDGRLAMVPLSLPGEDLVIHVRQAKKSHVHAELIHIDKPSTSRVTPPCPYYGECGGCNLQHGAYEEQLRIKRDIVADLLDREMPSASDGHAGREVADTLPSPAKFGYRQRIRLWVDRFGRCGFRKYRSHDIVPIDRCLLVREEINSVFEQLQNEQILSRLLDHTVELELLWNPETNQVTALFHLSRKPRPADFTSALQLTEAVSGLERIFFRGEKFPLTAAAPKACSTTLSAPVLLGKQQELQFSLSWEAGGFCQVNLDQNRHLIELVLEMAAIESEETVLDLFCGSGNFSIPLAHSAKALLGIEGQGGAIRSAKRNTEKAGLVNCTFRKQPIHAACKELEATGCSFDCLVIDPPRQGIPGLGHELAALCRSRIVYISCDPATLCRDLAELTATGFVIKRIQPVDMFPQTHHIETVVLLEKN